MLLADLVKNVSRIVCLPDTGLCNVSILSITVNDVTTFCTDGVCPGYARRRLLGLNGGVEVNLGIISKAMVSDFSNALSSIKSVVDTKIEPNAPVISTEQLAQLRDSRYLQALVTEKSTVFNVISAVNDGIAFLVMVASVVMSLIVLSVVLCCCCCFCNQKTQVLVHPSAANAQSQFPALDSIRISKESFKPYVKTA
jgi:hypothetical protein